MEKSFILEEKLRKKVDAVAIHPSQLKIEKALGKGNISNYIYIYIYHI